MREKMEQLQLQVEEMIKFVREEVSPSMAKSMRNGLVRVPGAKIIRSRR
jgi:hypothetical protein